MKAQPLKDQLGRDVPSGLRDLFGDPWLVQTAGELEAIFRDALRAAKSRVEKKGQRYKFLNVAEINKSLDCARTDLEIAASNVSEARPYAVCPPCEGKGCELCRRAGWLPPRLASLCCWAGRSTLPCSKAGCRACVRPNHSPRSL